MATVKAKFRPSSKPNLKGKVYYQVIHRREIVRITSSIALFPSEWDSVNDKIGFGDEERADDVEMEKIVLENDLRLLEKIIASLDKRKKGYTVNDVAKMFSERKSEPSFLEFMQIEISRRKGLGKDGTVHNFNSACNSFDQFLGERKLMTKEVNGELMETYQAWLYAKGLTKKLHFFLHAHSKVRLQPRRKERSVA